MLRFAPLVISVLAGNLSAQFPQLASVRIGRLVTTGPNGDIWIAGYGQVSRVDPNGHIRFKTQIEATRVARLLVVNGQSTIPLNAVPGNTPVQIVLRGEKGVPRRTRRRSMSANLKPSISPPPTPMAIES